MNLKFHIGVFLQLFGDALAQSAARALIENTELPPVDVIRKSLEIAGDLCIYTNHNYTIETLE